MSYPNYTEAQADAAWKGWTVEGRIATDEDGNVYELGRSILTDRLTWVMVK